MIEVNGWVRVVFMDNEKNDLLQIKSLTEKLDKYDNQKAEINHFNGSISIFIGGDHNHNNGYTDDIYDFLNSVGEIAKYSYGLIYIRLSDDADSFNKFKIYKLAKSKVTIEEDTLLSPCNPVIEE